MLAMTVSDTIGIGRRPPVTGAGILPDLLDRLDFPALNGRKDMEPEKMRRRQETDVLVIGGGAIGICSAYYLRRKGIDVVVVDRGSVCSGCSAGNGGLIVPSYSIPLASPGKILKGLKWMFNPESPFSIKPRLDPELIRWMHLFQRSSRTSRFYAAIPVIRDLNLNGLALFEELNREADLDLRLAQQGFLSVFNTPRGLDEIRKEALLLQAFDIPFDIVGADVVRDMTGGIRTMAGGGVFFPMDAHLDPRHFVLQVAASARRIGVRIHESTEVMGFRTVGKRIVAVETTRGDIVARNVVMAGGSWSTRMLGSLGIRIPMQPAKGYSVTFTRTKTCPTIPVGLLEAKTVLTPLEETFRVAGTFTFAGFDEVYRQRRIKAVVRSMTAYFPDIDPSSMNLVEIWQGFRPCSPDGLPYIGRTARVENLIIATGHGMLGITQAPISGKIVSTLATEDRPPLDIGPLNPDRFSRP